MITPKDRIVIDRACSEFKACVAQIEDTLEEPLKSKFANVSAEISKMQKRVGENIYTPGKVLEEIDAALKAGRAMLKQPKPQTKPAKKVGLC